MKKFLEVLVIVVVVLGISFGFMAVNPQWGISQKILPMFTANKLAVVETGTVQTTGIDLTNCISYFDGCNNCSVQSGQVATCTRMYCETPSAPKCLEYGSGNAVTGNLTSGIALGKNLGLSLSLSKGWTGKNITITSYQNSNSHLQKKDYIPINFIVKNKTNESLLLQIPVSDGEGPSSFEISCYATGDNLQMLGVDYKGSLFQYKPISFLKDQIQAAGKDINGDQRVDDVVAVNWLDNVVLPEGYMQGQLRYDPRLNVNGEISGSITTTCGLFVYALAGANDCGCKYSDNGIPNPKDVACFDKCYPDEREDERETASYYEYNKPGKYWIKVDEKTIKFNYNTNKILSCEYGCDAETKFRTN